jgi:hypothetical protein
MKYVLVTSKQTRVFTVLECAKLYQQIEGGYLIYPQDTKTVDKTETVGV